MNGEESKAANAPQPQSPPPMAPDQQLLDALTRLYHLAKEGQLNAVFFAAVDNQGQLLRGLKTDRNFSTESLIHTALSRASTDIMMSMARAEADQMAAQALAHQKVAEAAQQKAANDEEASGTAQAEGS